MKRRIFSLALALALLLTTPALAAPNSTDNFVRTKVYFGQFSDLPVGSTFYDNVAALYEYGLSLGKSDGTFGLRDNLTVGQIVIFASRIRSLYRSGDAEAGFRASGGDGMSTSQAHLRYLQREGVLGAEFDALLDAPATRAQVAHVLANTLPDAALPQINQSLVTQAYATRRYITDVTEYTPYYQDILKLYRTGVSAGNDTHGSFLPDQPVTRGAAAAMLTRMVDPGLRVTPAWDLSDQWSAEGAVLSDLVPASPYVAAPATAAELESSICYMLSTGASTLTLRYTSLSDAAARRIMEQSLSIVKTYVEQCYNMVTCNYTSDGYITLEFNAAGTGGQLQSYREQAMDAAVAVHDELWRTGQITAGMSEYEKARVYYTWICDNCIYDYTAPDDSICHIAYSLFHNGQAVCDGYTGAYNMFLKLEGIDCTALSNNSHIWTVATLDGVEYHIDTTWGDTGPQPNYNYFAMTAEQSWQHHSW